MSLPSNSIWDTRCPSIPFVPGEGGELPYIPQTKEDRLFASADLSEGCRTGIYRQVSHGHAKMALSKGAINSSAFVVWQEGDEGRKGRFVSNFCKQSKRWEKGSFRMESLAEFASDIQKGDHSLSMDVQKGYRHLRLHPDMREWFIFRLEGRYCQ